MLLLEIFEKNDHSFLLCDYFYFLKATSIRFTVILLTLFFAGTLLAQDFTLSGKVLDTQKQPIAFANVLLLDADQELLKGAITEDDGSFSLTQLEATTYFVKISFVGFEDYLAETLTLSVNEVLPVIILQPSSESLDEVVLTAKKPTISRKSDRLVFNVENTILSAGSTMDILRRTPGVIVNQDKITIRNERVTVYLNDRKVELDSEEIQSLLESIGGDAIKSVEVIANPPARYDAEGGPVLNIISSKAVSIGYKGSLNARGTYGIFPKHAFGTSQYFKSEKVNLFFNYSFNPQKSSFQSDNFIRYKTQNEQADWTQDFERKNWSQAHNANLILDYQLNEKSLLSFSAVGLYSPDVFDFTRSDTEVVSSSQDPFFIRTQSGLDSERTNIALDATFTRTLENGTLSANVHMTNFSRERDQRLNSGYRNEANEIFRRVRFESTSFQDIEIYTAQIDYATAIGTVALEAGAKSSIIDSRSVINFPTIVDDGVSGLNEAQNDDFLYDENIVAGYISLSKEWEKWSLKGGLRAEQTDSKGTSIALDVINDLSYFELFPTAYAQYVSSDKHSFSLDYSRRVDRPRYQDLNPFAYFLNENNFDEGNAQLIPAFSNRFNLNYTFLGEYSFDAYWRDNGEDILTLPFQDNENQVLRTSKQNAIDSKSWGLDFTHGRSIADWYYFYTIMSAFHEENTFVAQESSDVSQRIEVNGFFAYVGNFLTLSKDKTLSGEVSAEYFSKFIFGSYIQDNVITLNAGIQKTFWNKRGVLKLTANDILGEANAILRSQYLNQDNSYLAVPETQNFQIGFTYKFGNFKLEDNNREIENEEAERLKEKE